MRSIALSNRPRLSLYRETSEHTSVPALSGHPSCRMLRVYQGLHDRFCQIFRRFLKLRENIAIQALRRAFLGRYHGPRMVFSQSCRFRRDDLGRSADRPPAVECSPFQTRRFQRADHAPHLADGLPRAKPEFLKPTSAKKRVHFVAGRRIGDHQPNDAAAHGIDAGT